MRAAHRRFVALGLALSGATSCGDGAAGPDSASPASAAPRSGEIGPASGAAEGEVPRLSDVAAAAGIDFVHTHGATGKRYLFETMGAGVAAVDFDGDGLPDLLFVQSGTLPAAEFDAAPRAKAGHSTNTTCKLYLNDGRGEPGVLRFRDATAGSGLDVPLYGQGVAVGDVEGDGDRDLYLACYGRSHLLLNDGHARFADVTEASGIRDGLWTVSGAFFDAEGDGDLDLYAVTYLDMPLKSHRSCGPTPDTQSYCHVDTWPGLDDHLWINDGTGRFTDGSAAAGLIGARGKGLSAVGVDFDDDGDLDLFVANDSEANALLRNDGGGRFTDRARESGTDFNGEGRSEACMGTAAGDFDGDGDFDVYVVNFEGEHNTLYRNEGRLFFTDATASSGAGYRSLPYLGFGTVAVDLENDGDLDLYVANGHILDNAKELGRAMPHAQVDQFYLNDGRGRFALAPASWGPSLAEPRVGRGLACADFDRDGDLDLVVSNSNDRPWVLRNDAAHGHRVVLRLGGPRGRANAEGARVVLAAGGRTLVRAVTPGGSYASSLDTELVIGLGTADRIESLAIHWPGGGVSQHGPLPADRRYDFAFGGQLQAEADLPAPVTTPSAPDATSSAVR